MARLQRVDRTQKSQLDEFETRLFQLKIVYEKYFNGLEKLEPSRERDDTRRMLRDLEQERYNSTALRYRMNTLKARFTSIDLYIQRNLVMIERGTHPKFKFRADLSERGQAGAAPTPPPPSPIVQQREREEAAYKAVYDKYVEMRRGAGITSDVPFQDLRNLLAKQVRAIKSRYQCDSVKFRVVSEEGQVKIKAVPLVKRTESSPPGGKGGAEGGGAP